METKFSTCMFCDGSCPIIATYNDDGSFKVTPANPDMPAICSKAGKIEEYRHHPSRVTTPLKNVGKRGEPVWQKVSWDEALDEIADRLKSIISQYGPESVAFFETALNHGFGGLTRRLMNCIGTPNYSCPTELCMGNTAQVNRAVYGWYVTAMWETTDCVVYFGQNRSPERWPGEYLKLQAARKRGAKFIVIDPRRTPMAEMADIYLPIRYGTDAALAQAWVHTIIDEKLYDAEFVEGQCTGFDELMEAVEPCTAEWASEICGVPAELIKEAARMYAHASAAIIPWSTTPDMQVNSTALIQMQCILRSICGFINKSEMVFGPGMGGNNSAATSRFDLLPQEQRDKQLGCEKGPLLSFKASSLYKETLERFGVNYEPDLLAESCAAHPYTMFAAMRGEGPYPVKAAFSIANNTVMSYANQQGIVDAFMAQDLVVVYDHWITPTAQLADFVLPGDIWAERPALGPAYDMVPLFTYGMALCEPAGECKNWLEVVCGLARRLGYGEMFPWKSVEEFYDWKLDGLGVTWEQALAQGGKPVMQMPPAMGKFVTPSGKVELSSSIFKQLGFPGIMTYKEPLDPGAGDDYPYVLFSGQRQNKSYNTNMHQIESLRKFEPEPQFFINPHDAEKESIAEDEWCAIESAYGKVELMAHLDDSMPQGTLRIPHGWWKPETTPGLDAGLSGAMRYNDGMLFPDADWNLDPVQGLANLRGGIHGRIVKEQ